MFFLDHMLSMMHYTQRAPQSNTLWHQKDIILHIDVEELTKYICPVFTSFYGCYVILQVLNHLAGFKLDVLWIRFQPVFFSLLRFKI